MAESHQALAEFRHFREKMNAAILAADNLVIKRFFALDTRPTAAGLSTPRRRSCSGSWYPWCCGATIASRIT
jgi:hypothetical protein